VHDYAAPGIDGRRRSAAPEWSICAVTPVAAALSISSDSAGRLRGSTPRLSRMMITFRNGQVRVPMTAVVSAPGGSETGWELGLGPGEDAGRPGTAIGCSQAFHGPVTAPGGVLCRGMATRLSQRHITRSHAIRWSSPGGELPLLPDNTLGVIPQRSESS